MRQYCVARVDFSGTGGEAVERLEAHRGFFRS
jgi:hypothetical protein